jgi:broad specificity phosphatase PhoE
VIYLVRHAETEWNRQHRHQGHSDSPLTPSGIAQAHAVGLLLRSILGRSPDVEVQSSPLGRARRTAAIICQHLDLPDGAVILSELLIEHDMGHWQGLTPDEIDELYPGQRVSRQVDKWNFVIPGGESYALLDTRSRRWLAQLPAGRPIVAVTHEMISRTVRGAYAGLPPEATLSASHPQDCIYRLSEGRVEELRVAKGPGTAV